MYPYLFVDCDDGNVHKINVKISLLIAAIMISVKMILAALVKDVSYTS
jgi:hypothetical protein